ncbi:YbjQ family protein [Acholeplasma granularum]|uniref:YbjQ family protein n=1 Tax=Acholeplasma granularum TaxID=264635 RepID=UPI000472B6F8|nr:heavy metal-binding domain-containing protein [Acholeplasma granularum]
MKDFIISTTPTLEGYKIVKYIDILFEENTFGVSWSTSVSSFNDMFKGFTGERFDAISDRIEQVKKDVKQRFIRKAIRHGANALIGVDIETTTRENGGITISMSGTAVLIEKI